MIVFSASDKGGTGRSVTSSNLAYRTALQGADCCYLDFDFGSPTAGAIFDLREAQSGVVGDAGLHSYFLGRTGAPRRIDVWAASERDVLRGRPAGAGRLTFVPGDLGGGEFPSDAALVDRCAALFAEVDEQYELTVVDLSAGRSYATEIVLGALRAPELAGAGFRWLVFHRWTRQHIIAAAGLVHGPQGIIEVGSRLGHDAAALTRAIRFVRTAVLDPSSPDQAGLRPEQLAWLDVCNRRLQELAGRTGAGRRAVLGSVPLDPVLQWQEQLISNDDVWLHRTANQRTVTAFEELAKRLTDEGSWEGL